MAGKSYYNLIKNLVIVLAMLLVSCNPLKNMQSATGNDVASIHSSQNSVDKDLNYSIREKYWKLVELTGDTITVDSTFRREPSIIFKQNNSIIGHGGCNSLSGTFSTESQGRIKITEIASTDMACQAIALEQKLVHVLKQADNYTISGDTLVLNKGRMAPLARFIAVYLH